MKLQINHKIRFFGARKFRKPTKSVYHNVLLAPSFESTRHRPKTEPLSPTYAHFSEAPFVTRSWASRNMAHSSTLGPASLSHIPKCLAPSKTSTGKLAFVKTGLAQLGDVGSTDVEGLSTLQSTISCTN